MLCIARSTFSYALLLSLAWVSHGCKCVGAPSLLNAFQNADVVLQATLIKRVKPTSNLDVLYSARIVRAWKGCGSFKDSETITITTAAEGATCGAINLNLGTTYLLSGSLFLFNTSVYINSCGFQAPWKSVNATDVQYLATAYSTCTCTPTSCGPRLGMPTFICPDGVTFAGPGACSYSQKEAGCIWTTIQCPSCQNQSDCGKCQFCSSGKCRAVGTCANDVDCVNPQNQFAMKCPGMSKCKSSKCSLDCSNPCTNRAPLVNCFADPCVVSHCQEPHVSCASNLCGGCNSIFFNSSGYQVCSKTKFTETIPRWPKLLPSLPTPPARVESLQLL